MIFLGSCKNLIDLRKHLDTHSKEPAYSCDFENCTFSARSLYSIKSHYRKVHEVSGADGREEPAEVWGVPGVGEAGLTLPSPPGGLRAEVQMPRV